MKKLVSLLLVAVMLSASFLVIPVMAEENIDYFDVNFMSETNNFIVSGTKDLVGTNRVLLLVKDGDDTIYMDTMNAAGDYKVYFEVDLGKSLKNKEYSFILSSIGDTTVSQTLTCSADIPDIPTWFTVEFNSSENAFKVNSVEGEYTGTNRVFLTVYEPKFNAYQEIWYMDAINAASGSFSFTVPVNNMSPVGNYTFRVSVMGDITIDGYLNCEYEGTMGFTSYTEAVAGSTDIKIGGKYIVESDEEETIAVYVALYYKGEDDKYPQLVRATYSDEVLTDGSVKYIKNDLTLTEEEQTSDYYVRVYAWKQAELYPLAASININQ